VTPVTTRCANCSAPLSGRFCPACGQDSAPLPRSARRFLVQQTADLLGLDSRLARTVRQLVFRPGALTCAFLEGHRIRYVAPLNLYVVFSGLFFFLHTLRPFVWYNPGANALRSNLSAVSIGASLSEHQLARMHAAGVGPDVFAERFAAVATALLPAFLLGSLILFSAGVWLANRRSRLGGVAHPVFALHWGSFYLALGSLDRVLAFAGVTSVQLAMAYTVVGLVYLVMAVRRVFGRRWGTTALQAAVLLVWFYMLLAAWLGSVMAVAAWLTIP